LADRLLAGESQTLEYKTNFDRTVIESLVAFANAEGGTVLLGVRDDGVLQGVTLGKETLNEWLGQIKSATAPSLIPDLRPETLNGKTAVAIHIDEFPVKPVNIRGRYLRRVASFSRTRSFQAAEDASAEKGSEKGSEIGSEKSSEKILELLRAQPELSARELAQHLAITPRAVERQIDRLKQEGRLFRIGSARNGQWKVRKES
jgi:predicted HTH transcriptional regulator